MTYPRKDGSILLDHLLHIEQTTGRRDRLLDKLNPPECYADIWRIYWRIRRSDSFSFNEILAYKQLTGEVIERFEVDELLRIDAFIEHRLSFHKNSKKDKPS